MMDCSTDRRSDVSEPRQTQEEIHETIGAMAQLEKTLHRLIIEDMASLLATHQLWTLEKFDRQQLSHGEVLAGLGDLKKSLLTLDERMTIGEQMHRESAADRAHLHVTLARIETGLIEQLNDVTRRLAAIEARDAGQP